MRNKKVHYIKNEFEHNHKVVEYNQYIKDEPYYSIEDADIIACGGGDGTLLKTINKYRHLNKPFWGVNAGTVGFLMNDDYAWKYRADEVMTKKLELIKVSVTYTTEVPDGKLGNIYDKEIKVTKEFQAFNDVMLGGNMNSWIEFTVIKADNFIGDFKGGGVIISTPQGSTGINKNNNGAILSLASKLWSVTGDKTNRKINYVIKPTETIIGVASRNPVTLWVDGATHIIQNVKEITLTVGDTVEILFGDYETFNSKRSL